MTKFVQYCFILIALQNKPLQNFGAIHKKHFYIESGACACGSSVNSAVKFNTQEIRAKY